jgi:hypothetical protein
MNSFNPSIHKKPKTPFGARKDRSPNAFEKISEINKENIGEAQIKQNSDTQKFESSSPLRKKIKIEGSPIPSKYFAPSFDPQTKRQKIKIIKSFISKLSSKNVFDDEFVFPELKLIGDRFGPTNEYICKYIHKNIKKELLRTKTHKKSPETNNLCSALDKFIDGIEDIEAELQALKSEMKDKN